MPNATSRVLFLCVENSNRSQMAEAFARMLGQDVLEPWSAGSKPSGIVNPRAVRAMAEVGYDLTVHSSTGLDDLPIQDWHYVVTMGCGDVCPWVPAVATLDWDLPDPRSMNETEFNLVRDEIARRVKALIADIRADR